MEQGIRIRTVILLWLLLSGVSSIYAQSYIPFPTSNTTWRDGTFFTSGWQIDTSYRYFRTAGDISINDTLYTIISSENAIHFGYLREDNMKVYFRYGIDSDEFMLYDFSLNVGDTIILPIVNNQYIMHEMGWVYMVDSILIGSDYHRKIHIQSWIEVVFIEGIGSAQGLSLIHISEPTRPRLVSRMPSSA